MKSICIFALMSMFINVIYSGKFKTQPLQEINPNLIVRSLNRTIDISSQLVKINQTLLLENTGDTALIGLLFAVKKKYAHLLAYMSARSGKFYQRQLRISDVKVKGHTKSKVFKYIVFKESLSPKQSTVVKLEMVYCHRLKPLPSSITQEKTQLVVFVDSHYVYTPYIVYVQRTVVVLGSAHIESYSYQLPVRKSRNKLIFGPFYKVNPFSISSMSFHYENNAPFVSARRVQRTIVVSHWGAIDIQEEIDIVHKGASLKGRYQRNKYSPSAVSSFRALLPLSAKNIKFYDKIGYIVISNITPKEDNVELILQPRFPLMGGWKTSYNVRYSLPTYDYLFQNGTDYILKMKFVESIFDDMCIDELETRIILPEGSSEALFYLPYPVKRMPIQVYHSYLDIIGRPTIILKKTNVLSKHIVNFEVYYTYSSIFMFQKPLTIILVTFAGFLGVAVFKRIESKINITQNVSK